MSLSILKIWNFSEDVAKASLKQLLDAGFVIKTDSNNTYIQIFSALTGQRHTFLDELNNDIISDKFFLNCLEKAEADGLSQDDILIRAIQESDNKDLKRIMEHHAKAKQEEIESKRKSLLEDTYNDDPKDICTLDLHDESNFYFIDPVSGEKKLLEAHHLFHYREHCYDIDTIYRYINAGGNVHLDADYIKKFFNKNGSIDLSGMKLTSEELKKKTFHQNVHVMYLDNNNLTTLRDTHLPKTLTTLSVNNNPLKGGYFLNVETPKLLILSMRECGFDKIDCEYLPQSLNILDVSNNKKLTELHSLKNMRNLRKLDIRNTNIKKLDWSKFMTIDPKKKLIVMCDNDVTFKKVKPDWIDLKISE